MLHDLVHVELLSVDVRVVPREEIEHRARVVPGTQRLVRHPAGHPSLESAVVVEHEHHKPALVQNDIEDGGLVARQVRELDVLLLARQHEDVVQMQVVVPEPDAIVRLDDPEDLHHELARGFQIEERSSDEARHRHHACVRLGEEDVVRHVRGLIRAQVERTDAEIDQPVGDGVHLFLVHQPVEPFPARQLALDNDIKLIGRLVGCRAFHAVHDRFAACIVL
eukprot:6214706-Pleurochrysis_carterae.AAC.3